MVVGLAMTGPLATPGTNEDDPLVPRPVLFNADGANDGFSGVAQVDGLGSTCTGFLVDTGDRASPAAVITNGHCTWLFDATTIVTETAAPEGALVRFGRFADTLDAVLEVPVAAVRYATMRSTDVAVVELDTTLGVLLEEGVAAYTLGPPPGEGDEVRVVGIPVVGVDPDEQVLRGDTCTAGATVRLVEWEWLWDSAVATDCAGILGGNSGSPVFAAGDPATVVAMVNTTTIGAGPGGSCYLGQPCEIGPDETVEVKNATYAMSVDGWAACVAAAFVVDEPGCPVEPASAIAVDAPVRAAQPGATWSATISAVGDVGDVGDVAVKSGSAASTDCRDATGYGEPRPIAAGMPGAQFDEPVAPEAVAPAEGIYVLCAAPVDGTGEPVTAGAGYAVMEIDATPPVIDIELAVRSEPGDAAWVEPLFSPPELSSFHVKVGPFESTDCSADDGYRIYRRVPIDVPADQQPAIVCVIGEDEAGNRSEPQSFDVP